MITPILRKPHTDADVAQDNAEARMRQALGKLGTAKAGRSEAPRRAASHQAKPGAGRHRFKQDGDVPVIRISLAEGGRRTERQAQGPIEGVKPRHKQADKEREQGVGESARQVQELAEQLRATQTRLGHAVLALQEAGREAQARQEEAAGLRQALDIAGATLARVQAELAVSERAREALERRREAPCNPAFVTGEKDDSAPCRKVGRLFGSTNRIRDKASDSGPMPVKWWAGD